jgi:D-alanyl-D-alanine carboxypeptidase
MRKVFGTLAVICMLLATLNLAVAQSEQQQPADKGAQTWTGWISDSSCGAKGANAQHRDCATKCIKEKGASWVFVNAKTKQVLNIHNQDAVNPDTALGQPVKVNGHLMDDGSLHVETITPAS